MRLAVAAAALIALVAAGCGASVKSAAKGAPKFAGGELDPPAASPDFALRDAHGRLVRLSDQRGRFVLVTFLYTHCPDVCPLIASNLNEALRQLGAKSGVQVLAVSVDPKRDTPSAVRAYERAHRLVPQFHYLIGTRRQLVRVWKAYHLAVLPEKLDVVAHTSYTLLLDREGRQRLIYDAKVKAAAVVHDVRLLTKE